MTNSADNSTPSSTPSSTPQEAAREHLIELSLQQEAAYQRLVVARESLPSAEE